MSVYPECKHGHGDPMSQCPTCEAEKLTAALSEMEKVRKERDIWKANEEDARENGRVLALELRSTSTERADLQIRLVAALAQVAELTKEREALRVAFAEASHNAGPAFCAHEELAQLRHEKEQANSPMFSRRELLADRDALRARVTELEAAIAEKDEALKAQAVFHTPLALSRKETRQWDEYEIDAINRCSAALSSTGSSFLDQKKRMEVALKAISERRADTCEGSALDECAECYNFATELILRARAALNPQEETQ